MKRYSFFISLFLCFLFPVTLYAQDTIPLRVSDRDGYSRLTFAWKEKVQYTLENSNNGNLVIIFKNLSNFSLPDTNFSEIDNIASAKVISKNPVKLSFIIPKTSSVRDFKIGNRIIFDVYAPKDKEEAKAFKQKPVLALKPVEVKKENLIQHKTKEKINNKPKDKPKVKKLALKFVPEHSPSKKHKQESKTPTQYPKPPSNKKLEAAVNDDTHVVSFRAIKTLNIAAFENFGELWLVLENKDGETPSIPNLSSSKENMFSKFSSSTTDNSITYQMSLPPKSLKMKAKGGGLVWDLIMSDNLSENPPIKPKWKISDKTSLHSGKMFIPLENIIGIIDIPDTITGQTLKIVTVDDISKYSIPPLSYVDFDILRSPIGLAVRPKVDNLQVKIIDGGIEISRPNGLAISLEKDMSEAMMFAERAKDSPSSHFPDSNDDGTSKSKPNSFFHFKEWSLGGDDELSHNDNILLSGMKDKSDARRIEDLLAIGKMYLSHARGAEALGYFNYAASQLSGLEDSPEFRALRGVAKAIDWKSDDALSDLLYKGLENYDEVKYWKSYALADLGDWQQAASILPNNYKLLYNYPDQIGNRLALVLAEVNLRDGNVKNAEELMAFVDNRKNNLLDPQKAALKYLRGEAYRQKGKIDKTKQIWTALTQDKDDLYRTKAGLALTILMKNSGEIKNKEVIDRLERLRYAWRGDELEAQVNYWLGKSYFKSNDYIKGLSIMRDAASVAGDIALGHRITDNMSSAFLDFFLKNKLEDISAVDAITLYEQFSELTPVGNEGDKLVQKLAEHMVRSDLLGRATKLLHHQVTHRLKGGDKIRVAIRLATIELLYKRPQKAMNALGTATTTLSFISDKDEKEKRTNEIALLKIRAYSQNKQFDKALSLIENMPVDNNLDRLRADIAWQAGYWDESADALNSVIIDENISMTRPLSKEQADLILNRSIALSLSSNRIALSNLRKKYSDLMLATNKSNQFEVITRPRNNGALADREALLSIVSEVDLFKGFLDSYRASPIHN